MYMCHIVRSPDIRECKKTQVEMFVSDCYGFTE